LAQRLALHLLGPSKLDLDDAPVTADRRKTLALLAYLAVNRGGHTREYLSALLWPDYDQTRAFTNLRHTLWETQQAIGEGWILADHETIGFIADSNSSAPSSGRVIWLDVACFESLINESRAQKDISLRIPLLTDSVKLYRNHFLTGFSLKDAPGFNEWVFAESENLRHQLARALSILSADHCSLGQSETAIPYARRLIVLDPLNEASHRHLMQIYIQAGQHNAALKQYQICEKILRKELGVDPQAETRALYKQIRKGEFKSTQTAKQKESNTIPLHNIPFQLSTFIGRENEQSEVTALIADHRLVTLIGTGGIGKTRLSLKVGAQLLKDHVDGVWLVELASLSDPARVPQTVAARFGLIEGSEESPTEKLINALRAKTMLLILDNCEHVLDACAQLADTLLKNCPNMKILATSREALSIAGEALYHVPSLALPDAQQFIERLLEYESIQLFEERARLVQEKFSLTMDNASSIAQICRRLDGIPLAIELAAARVDMFSTEQIAARLNESFNLLTSGHRTTLPRHQTLRASVDWSWKLLSESERTLLRRLAVFAGGWTLGAAESVCAENGIEPQQVLNGMTQLAAKSLVVVNQESGRERRYRMLETIREYALERLKDSNEEEGTRNRHLDFYVAMADQAEPKLFGREQGLWMRKLSDEQENIITANDWCHHSKSRTEQGFRLLGGTRYYWVYAGLAKLGFKIYSEALAGNLEKKNTLAQGLIHDGISVYGEMLKDPSTPEHIEKSISIFQAYGDNVRLSMALSRKALWQTDLGNHAKAIKIYNQALSIGRQTGDNRPISSALNNMAELYRLDEEFEKAAPLYEEALGIDRDREDSTGIVLALVNLVRNELMQGVLDPVRSQLAEAARIADESLLIEYGQNAIEASAILRFAIGEHFQGARLYGAAEVELRKKGYQLAQPDEKFVLYWTTKMREILDEATFSAAMAEGAKLSYEAAMVETRKWLEEMQE
jgi:predicted ATPase/DNA-binding SARP family transcriptional activator